MAVYELSADRKRRLGLARLTCGADAAIDLSEVRKIVASHHAQHQFQRFQPALVVLPDTS
jgi:hypothetical protein